MQETDGLLPLLRHAVLANVTVQHLCPGDELCIWCRGLLHDQYSSRLWLSASCRFVLQLLPTLAAVNSSSNDQAVPAIAKCSNNSSSSRMAALNEGAGMKIRTLRCQAQAQGPAAAAVEACYVVRVQQGPGV
jgi:hypothetical protein